MQVDIDKTDRLLVQALQQDARLTSGELAQLANLSQSPTWRRVRRLEEAGLILGYHAALDRRALGYGVLAFVLVGIDILENSSSAMRRGVHRTYNEWLTRSNGSLFSRRKEDKVQDIDDPH